MGEEPLQEPFICEQNDQVDDRIQESVFLDAMAAAGPAVADVASGRLPKSIDRLAEDPEAWVTR